MTRSESIVQIATAGRKKEKRRKEQQWKTLKMKAKRKKGLEAERRLSFVQMEVALRDG
jgi:hypothetical protein